LNGFQKDGFLLWLFLVPGLLQVKEGRKGREDKKSSEPRGHPLVAE
jgi:hypothetical protein